MRLLVGDILAGVDELLREVRQQRPAPCTGWPARLGEVTVQLSLAELTLAGQQLRAALASIEHSSDLLGLHARAETDMPPAPARATVTN